MARYTKVLKSLAHNAVGNKRIESAAPAGNNYYVTGATLGSAPNYTLTLARNGGLSNVTVNLSALAATASPGGSNTQLQYNNGGSFGGMDDWTWDGTDLSVAGSSKLKFGASLRHIVQSGDNLLIRNSESNGNIELNAKNDMKFFIDGAQKMHIDSNGKVGIGTNAPAQSLDVRGTTLLSGATDTVPFEVFAFGAGTSALHVTSGSNTGLGTATPLAKLHINASAYQMVFQRDSYNHTIVKGNSDDGLTFATGAPGSHTARFKILPTGVDVVNDATITGNVGIGTTSPATKLDVRGSAKIGSSSYTTISDNEYDVSSGDFLLDVADDITLDAAGGDVKFSKAGGNKFTVYMDGSDNVWLQAKGSDKDLNITGVDSTTGQITALSFDMSEAGNATFNQNVTVPSNILLGSNLVHNGDTDTYLGFETDNIRFYAGNTNTMNIKAAGVGIGTNAPDSILDVHKDSTSPLVITAQNATAGTSSYSGLNIKSQTAVGWLLGHSDTRTVTRYGVTVAGYNEFLSTAGNGILFGTNYSAPIIIGTNDTERMRILSGGNVGIGTSSPSTKLHVVGDALIDGYLHADKDGSPGLLVGEGGDADIYYDGTDMQINPRRVGSGDINVTAGDLILNGDSTAFSIKDADGTETVRLATASGDEGLLYLRGPTGGNSIYLDGNSNSYINNGANLGIGTTSPGEKLHVVGTSRVTGKAAFGGSTLPTNNGISVVDTVQIQEKGSAPTATTAYGTFWVSGSTPNKPYFTDDAGNHHNLLDDGPIAGSITDNQIAVGASTANSIEGSANLTWDATTLDVQGSILVDPSTGSDTAGASAGIKFNAQDDSGVGWNLRLGDTSDDGDFNIDRLYSSSWYKSASIDRSTGDFIWYDDDGSTEKMRWDASTDRLGIGTAVPPANLSILGDGANTSGIQLSSDGTNWGKIYVDTSDKLQLQSTNDAVLYAADDILLQAVDDIDIIADDVVIHNSSSTEYARFNSGESALCLGATTTQNGAYLHVTGSENLLANFISSDGIGEIRVGDSSKYTRLLTAGNQFKIMPFDGVELMVLDGSTEKVGIGTNAPAQKLYVSGGAATFDNGGSHSVYFKNAGSQYGAIDVYGTSLSIEASNEAILSGASGVLLKGGNYGVLLPPLGTSAGDTTRLRFRELAANGTATVSVKAPDSIASDIQLVLPASAGTANQVLAIDSVSSGVMTLGFQTASGGGVTGLTGLVENNSIFLGADPSSTTSTAERNVSLGTIALDAITTGDDNVSIGYQSLTALTEGNDNVAVGKQAGAAITTGVENTLLGSEAGESLVGGGYNTVIGSDAYKTATAGNYAIAIGKNAMNAGLVTSSFPIGIGYEALKNLTSATETVAIGAYAGDAITTGGDNTAVGHKALSTVSTGGGNTAMGREAMRDTSAGSIYNTAIGVNAIFSSGTPTGSTAVGWGAAYYPSGNYNTFLGFKAGYGDSTTRSAHNNVAVGKESLFSIQDGQENVAIGDQAGYSITSADYNVAIGSDALRGVTTGAGNIGIGRYAGASLATDQYTIAIGSSAAQDATTSESVLIGQNSGYSLTGDQNIAIGKSSLFAGTTANKNVAIGHQALTAATEAHSSIAIGYQALDSTTKGSENVAIGAYAGQALVGTTSSVYGGFSTFIGHTAGYQITGNVSYGGNTMVGHAAGYSATGADRSTGIGSSALYYADGAKYNTAVGRVAGAYAKGTGSTHVGDSSGYRISGNYNTSIGFKALSGASSGTGYGTAQLNVAIGYSAMEDSTDAAENVVVGSYAAGDITSGDYNTVVGYAAARKLTAGNRNVALGYAAMNSYTQTGDGYNVSIGMYSMMNVETGSANIAIGYQALRGVTGQDVDYNVAIGDQALYAITTGDNNVAVGRQAGVTLTTGGDNVMLGYQAGENVSTASATTLLGYKAGYSNNADSLVAVGKNAGYSNSSGGNNIFVGFSSGHSNSTGASNVMIGYQAGYPMNANNNVVIGTNAGVAATSTTNDSVLIGNEAGYSTAGNQIAIGRQALYFPEGNYNVAIGQEAMHGVSSPTTAEQNVAIGRQTLFDVTSGHSNTAVGYQAGTNVTSAIRSEFIGHSAGYNVTTAQYVTAIGYQAGYNLTTTGNNVLIGKYAGKELTKDFNTMVGIQAGQNTTTGINNTYLGTNAAKNSSTGYYNVAVGHNAGNYLSGATGRVDIGYGAGYYVSGNGNVFIGLQAGMGDATQTTNSANYNVGIGYEALKDITSGVYNIALGWLAGENITAGNNSVIIGNNAGQAMTTQNENVLVGQIAGQDLTGQYNVFLGSAAGSNATSSDNNVAIGRQAMAGVMTGDSNVGVGYRAGYANTSGGDNVFIGVQAGNGNTTASNNVAVGKGALYAVQDSSNGGLNTAIGQGAAADLTGMRNTMLGYKTGYTSTSANSNVYIGYEAGYKNTTGDSNVYIGNKAGPSSTSTESNKLYIHNDEGTPLIGGDFSSGGTLTFTASGNAPDSVVFKHSQVSTNGADGITIDAYEPRLKLVNRRGTDETWQIAADNESSSLQIKKDSHLVKAIFSPDDGGGVTFGIAAVAATSGVAIAQGASYSLDNTTVNRIYRTSNDVSYMSNELHYFNNPVKVNGNLATASLGQALEFADRDDLLIRGTASFDMEITAPQDVAFGIDSDNNETTHAFLWKKDTKTPSSAGTELMRLNEAGNLGIGTNAPSYPLHISGAATQEVRVQSSDSGAYSRIQLRSATNGYAQLNMGDSGADAAGGLVYTHSTDTLNIRAANSNIANVTSTGVGIGTTAPAELLHLKGGKLEIENSDSSKHLQIDENSIRTTTSNDLSIFTNSNSNQLVLNQSNGRIGMGTSSPADKLHVYHATLNTMALFESGDSKSLIKIKDNASTQYVISESSKLSMGGQNALHASNLNIDSAGNVGIGTTTPSQKLDVAGAAQIGSLIVTGSTLAVQRTMKNDITSDTTLSDSYSVYQALADGGGPGTVTITAPPSPSTGDTYLIVAGAFGNPGGGGAPTLTGLVRIIANTGQTINGVNTNISLMQSTALQPEYKTAHLVCVDTNTWVMTLSAQAPVA